MGKIDRNWIFDYARQALNFFTLYCQIKPKQMTKIDLKEFPIYFLVGSFVGVTAVLAREIVILITQDTPIFYFVSVILVYFFGIILGFFMHKRFTYKIVTKEDTTQVNFFNFVGIALLGMLLTGFFSLALRYGLDFDIFIGNYAGSVAFILAALLTSVITYYLHSRFSFIR
ncbi:MAG: GtrA family protein [Thiomargarita sp.]|nr:GtrA family protein [Thiomargarita sp.]